jgi:hypothetical protein
MKEQEIIKELGCEVTTRLLYDIHEDNLPSVTYGDNEIVTIGELELPEYFEETLNVVANAELYTVYKNKNDELQVFFLINNGTNGKEGNIKSSMQEAIDGLDALEANEHVKWCQILDVWIDNADDVYAYVFTYTLK